MYRNIYSDTNFLGNLAEYQRAIFCKIRQNESKQKLTALYQLCAVYTSTVK